MKKRRPKKIHWKTRLAIIREHERNSRLLININGRRFIDSSLEDVRTVNRLQGRPADLLVDIEKFLPRPPEVARFSTDHELIVVQLSNCRKYFVDRKLFLVARHDENVAFPAEWNFTRRIGAWRGRRFVVDMRADLRNEL